MPMLPAPEPRCTMPKCFSVQPPQISNDPLAPMASESQDTSLSCEPLELGEKVLGQLLDAVVYCTAEATSQPEDSACNVSTTILTATGFAHP